MLRPPSVRPAAGHALAIAVTLVAVATQRALVPSPQLVPYLLMFPAVVLAAWIGGRGPGFTATALATVLASALFLPPAMGWPGSGRALALSAGFGVVASLITLLCGSLRDALGEAEHAAALLRAVQAQMPAGVIVADADGRLLAANDELARIFRHPVLAASGVADVARWPGFHPDGRPYRPEEWPLARSLQRGETVVGEEIEIERGDGTRGVIAVNAAPVRDGAGRVVAGVVVEVDITARKRAEAEKDELLAILSHELRNPLTPIGHSLAILDRAPPGGAEALRARAVLGRQLAHLTRLVDDLLDVTRIDRGKVALRPEPVDLVELVRGALDDHRPAFAAAGVTLEVALLDHPLWLRGDPVRLAQVVGNLLTNACKFTPAGGRVRVGLAEADGHAVLEVRDTGLGVAPALLTRIFEPFVQAERTLERSRGGLGLGLALVKGLVELHGGRVEAASDGPGTGAAFTVRVPLDPGAAPVVAAAPAPAPARRVLIVEDNLDAAESLAELLRFDGHEVEVAHTGPDGLARARAWVPELVLCDIGLPELDGYGVARALRADPRLDRTLLVALTGYGQPEDRARAEAAGFDRHLTKPPSHAALQAALAVTRGPARDGGC